MIFFALPDAAPAPIYQAAVLADSSSASVPTAATRKMTYGVCDLSVANENKTLRTVPYLKRFLSKDMQLKLSLPNGAFISEDAQAWLQQADNFAKTVLIAPTHGKLVNSENDTYIEYLPTKGYVGKDSINLLVEGKDDLGRPIAMTIRYYINVLPRKEINKLIVNEQTYSKAIKKYCGTSKESWRISYSNPVSKWRLDNGRLAKPLHANINKSAVCRLPSCVMGQTSGQSFILDYSP